MHAGPCGAVVRPGVAHGPVGARGAQAAEAVHLVQARPPAHAGVRQTLVDLHVALGPLETRHTHIYIHLQGILLTLLSKATFVDTFRQGEASYSVTPRHSARRSRASN